MKNVLFVPIATKDFESPEFNTVGMFHMLNCVEAIAGIELIYFDEIVYIIDYEVERKLNLSKRIKIDIDRDERLYISKDTKLVFEILHRPTFGMADTVYQILVSRYDDLNDIRLFIKDGDNTIWNGTDKGYDITNYKYNALITASLEDQDLVDPIHKSYVTVDNQGFVTNIIEKRVISDKFVAGGYFFQYGAEYAYAFEKLKDELSKFYISDIVYWLIFNKGLRFTLDYAPGFIDFNLDEYGVNSIEYLIKKNRKKAENNE